MLVYWLDKETKQLMGQGNDTDLDLSVETHLEKLITDIEPIEEIIDPDSSVQELKPVRWTGTEWELITI